MMLTDDVTVSKVVNGKALNHHVTIQLAVSHQYGL